MIIEAPAATPRARRSRVATALTWTAATACLIWAVLRLAGIEPGPLVQLLAFTPYVAAGSLVPLVAALVLRHRAAAGVALVASLLLIAVVAPRALPSRQPATEGPTLTVLTANLLAGGADPATLVTLVRDNEVDVLALQEFTPEAETGLDRAGLAALLPHRHTVPEVGTTGSAVYSRHPLTETGSRRNTGFEFLQAYGTVTLPGAPPVRIESVHPAAPYAPRHNDAWRDDLAAQPPATPDGPLHVLAGDFNATLDHAPLRRLIATGYADAAAATGNGLAGTWGPYDGAPIPPVAIDHVLADRRIAVVSSAVYGLPGSDHRAVLAVLRLPAAG